MLCYLRDWALVEALSFFYFYSNFSPMSVTIELPETNSMTSFNLERWTEVLRDPRLADMSERIETNRYGHILMSPGAAPRHGLRQNKIGSLLDALMPHGQTINECPVSTADGVKVVDVAWLRPDHPDFDTELVLLRTAPDICVEVLSPSNSKKEMDEKKVLYFDAGAREVWFCDSAGKMTFYSGVETFLESSILCPTFPKVID
jgi:Uma2 family endonuclease